LYFFSVLLFPNINLGVPNSLFFPSIKSFDKMDHIKLAKQYKLTPKPIMDVNTIAGQLGIQRRGLASLCKSHLMHQLSKEERMTRWSIDNLSEKQLIYAATDSWATRRLYFILAERVRLNEELNKEKKDALEQKRLDLASKKQKKQERRAAAAAAATTTQPTPTNDDDES
jgi:ribonuclease D